MMILGLDYGTKRIGIALGDTETGFARPLPFLEALPFANFLAQLKELVTKEGVELMIIGMPRNMDGSYGESAQNVRSFMAQLGRSLTIPMETLDERLSTVQASRQLREAGHKAKEQRSKIDSASATVILQAYFDRLALGAQIDFESDES